MASMKNYNSPTTKIKTIKQCEVHRGPLNHISEAEDKGKTTWEKINNKNEQIIIKKQFIHLHPNRSSCHLPPENYL